MAKFEVGNTKGGRTVGAKNKKGSFSQALTDSAIAKLSAAVEAGEPYAVTLVISRCFPALKAVTPKDSIDGKFLLAKIEEITLIDKRITALENKDVRTLSDNDLMALIEQEGN